MEQDLIPISKMAEMHRISRQTLILYDKKNIFKPAYVGESGYRYYSVYQIPYLREICFLRKLGVSLERIAECMNSHGPQEMHSLLVQMEKETEEQLKELQQRKKYIDQRLQVYADMNIKLKNVRRPYIKYFPEMKVVFAPFEKETVDRKHLHLTLMSAWDKVLDNGMVPSKGFGTLLKYNEIKKGVCLKGAGSIIPIPFPEQMKKTEELYTIPAGEYATMYKYGMPYDVESVLQLVDWIHEQGYEIIGDIVDMCFMDTTFYNDDFKEDFCQLRIPIRTRQ